MITQVQKPICTEEPHVPKPVDKPHHHCDDNCGCKPQECLKVDNFLAEYSGNPAPVLENLGVYSKAEVDQIIEDTDRLVSIRKEGSVITITDKDGNQTTFRVLDGEFEFLLENFIEEVSLISKPIAENTVNELAPGLADIEINKLAPGIADAEINKLVPGIADSRIRELTPNIADQEINKLTPGIAEEVARGLINNLTGDIAKDQAERVVKELAPDIAKKEANTLITSRVPGMAKSAVETYAPAIAKSQATTVVNELVPGIATTQAKAVVEDYLSWNIVEDDE